MKNAIIAIIALVLVTLIGGYIFLNITYGNKEIRQRNGIEAQVESNKSHFTKMWQIMKDQAGVAEEYKESFREIYTPLIEGRYSHGGGQMMQWITEHNPTFDSSLFKKLMASIEAQRESFHYSQQQLIGKHKQYKDLVMTFPGNIFLSDIEVMEIPVIKNKAAEQAFETGLEPEMDMFSRNKKSNK